MRDRITKFNLWMFRNVFPTHLTALAIAISVLVLFSLTGCSGGGGTTPVEPNPTPTPTTLTVTPMSADMVPTQTQVFTSNTSASWNVLPAGCGTLSSPSGASTTFTAGNFPGTCYVAATAGNQTVRPVVQIFTTSSIRYISSSPDLMSGATLSVGQDVSVTVSVTALTATSRVGVVFYDNAGNGFDGAGHSPFIPLGVSTTVTVTSHLTITGSPNIASIELVDGVSRVKVTQPTNLVWR